MIQFKATLAKK